MLGHRIDLYIHEYKLAGEAGNSDNCDRDIGYEIEKQKSIETLGCEVTKKYLVIINLSIKYLYTLSNCL